MSGSSLDEMVVCPNCGRKYNVVLLGTCPRCRTNQARAAANNQIPQTFPVASPVHQQSTGVGSDVYQKLSSMYLGAIAYFLKALWFVVLSGISGQWAMSQYSARIAEISMKLTMCGGAWSRYCSEPSIIGFWIIPAIISTLLMLFAGFAGSQALGRLRQAG